MAYVQDLAQNQVALVVGLMLYGIRPIMVGLGMKHGFLPSAGSFVTRTGLEYCKSGRNASISRNTTPITPKRLDKREHGRVLLHHAVEGAQGLARRRYAIEAVRDELRPQSMQ